MKKILILAGDIDGNLGDKAIVTSTCESLTSLSPDIHFTLVSDNPSLEQEFSNVTTVPKGWKGFFQVLKHARESDLVLCGGGGLFQDDDSLVKMPYWAVRLLVVRLFCKKIVGYTLGVGPLRFSFSRFFARLAFACMVRVSVRCPRALKTAREATKKSVKIVPDPALLLNSGCREEARAILEENQVPLDGRPLIGVALRKWFHNKTTFIPHKYAVKYRLRKIPGEEKRQAMIQLLARVFDRIVQEHGAFIVFLPTYNVSHEADDNICRQVMDAMASKNTRLVGVQNPKQYKALSSHLNVMLGGRMHPTILAASEAIPVVGLSYNQKFFGFFELLGAENSLLDIEDFVKHEQTEKLVELLARSINDKPAYVERVHALGEDILNFNRELMTDILEKPGG